MPIQYARAAIRRVQALLPGTLDGVCVLAYHLVDAGTGGAVDLDRATFRRHLDELAAEATVISLAEAVRDLKEGDAHRADAALRVVLTFDDAFDNFRTQALPELESRGLSATLYVPTGFIDGQIEGPLGGATHLAPMGWEDLLSISSEGLIELGSHSVTHRDLRTLSETEVRRELADSAARIEDMTGARPQSFCFPRAHQTSSLIDLASEYYEVSTVGGGVRNRASGPSLRAIQRVSLRKDQPGPLLSQIRSRVNLEEFLADRLRQRRRVSETSDLATR